MSTPFVEKVLKDRDGSAVTYMIRQHPAEKGLEVVDVLLQMGLGPILQMLFEALDLPKDYAELDEVKQAAIWNEAKAKLDVQSIAKQAVEGIRAGGGLKTLAPMLLEFSTRTVEGGQPQKLKDKTVFAEAYQGNYGELIAACKEVISVNGFFEVLSTFIG